MPEGEEPAVTQRGKHQAPSLTQARQGGRADAAFRAYLVRPASLESLHRKWWATFIRLRAVRERDGEGFSDIAELQLLLAEEVTADIAHILGKAICGRCPGGVGRHACTHLVDDAERLA